MDLGTYLPFLNMAFILSIVLTMIAIPQTIRIAFQKQLFDVPDYRKVHTGQVPRLGGATFLPGIMISSLMSIAMLVVSADSFLPENISSEIMLSAAGALFLYMAGISDDLVGLSYKAKFPIQILAAVLICISGLWIDNLHGLLGIHRLPAIIGIPFSVIFIVLIINAINLIDGIDGLASGLCIVSLAALTLLFVNLDLVRYSIIGVASLGVLLPFYIYNVYGTSASRTKIFMGDAGSLTMGYIIAVFVIKAATYPDRAPLRDNEEGGAAIFVYALSILIVPVLDVARLFCHRILRGRNPFTPDRCHIHHKFMAVGLTIGQARHTIILISLFFCISNIILIKYLNINIIVAGDILLWTLMHVLLTHRIKVLKARHAESANNYLE